MLKAILALFFISSSVFAAPLTFVEMHSLGDYVVPAGDYYYDESNATITGGNAYASNSTYYQNSPSFNISYDNGSGWSGYWNIDFSTHELGGPMTVGIYDNAVRFPFEPAGTPGISIYGNGRGNNTLTGSFEVLDVTYSGNTLLSFAAVFEQNNVIFGKISYNSEAFSPVPLPASFYLFFSGLLFLVKFSLRRN